MRSFTYVYLIIACQILDEEQLYPFQKNIVHSHLLKKSLFIRFYFVRFTFEEHEFNSF